MRIAATAWNEVDATTIRSCWQKSGITPDNFYDSGSSTNVSVPINDLFNASESTPNSVPLANLLNPVVDAEKEVEEGLDKLERYGVLQKSNRMSLEALLNPDEEKHIVEECSDQDIFEDVTAAEQSSEDIADDDNSEPDVPAPTGTESLQAVSTVQRFISSIDDLFAHKLEGIGGDKSTG
ncbi:hypothetical protein C8J56DRAFT_1068024 [Mycena floridula]|nr:hypothetical protein C8J56DRAFT_1068024 [Mycena floridula]